MGRSRSKKKSRSDKKKSDRKQSRSKERKIKKYKSTFSNFSSQPPADMDPEYIELMLNKGQKKFEEYFFQISAITINIIKNDEPIQPTISVISTPQTPNILLLLNDPNKIKRKLMVPQNTGFNYTGLILGPKGSNQKKLEESTGCKILIRGKGSQKEGIFLSLGTETQPDDQQPMHVLIVGDNELNVQKAVIEIENILQANENTLNAIRQEQLKMIANMKLEDTSQDITNPIPTGYNSYAIPVANQYVQEIMGFSGQNLKMLELSSGAQKLVLQNQNFFFKYLRSRPSCKKFDSRRILFISPKCFVLKQVQKSVQEIIQQHTLNQSSCQAKITLNLTIPNNMVGLVIGKNGETIKSINQRTGAYVFISPEVRPGETQRPLSITGIQANCDIAKKEVMDIVNLGIQNLELKQGLVQRFSQNLSQPNTTFAYSGLSNGITGQSSLLNSSGFQQGQFQYQLVQPVQNQQLFNQTLLPSFQTHDNIQLNQQSFSGQQTISPEQSAMLLYQELMSSRMQPTITETVVSQDSFYTQNKRKWNH